MIITQMMPMAKPATSGVTLTVTANMLNLDIYAAATGIVPSGVTRVGTYSAGTTVNVIVNSGVVVGSSSIATYSVDTGTGWNVADVVTMTNGGSILGMGGNANGGAGGPALRAQRSISITNNGTIGGGGGGGGYGAYVYGTAGVGKSAAAGYSGGGGGGGGQGSNGGVGGGQNGGNSGSVGFSGRAGGTDSPFAGAAGTPSGPGVVGGATAGWGGICYVGAYNNSYVLYGGNGGNGGTLGAAGTAGAAGAQGGVVAMSTVAAQGPGGAGGACTNGIANITWTTTGTRYGTLG